VESGKHGIRPLKRTVKPNTGVGLLVGARRSLHTVRVLFIGCLYFWREEESLTGEKDEKDSKPIARLLLETKAAQEEEWRAQEEFLSLLNARAAETGREVVHPAEAFKYARRVIELGEKADEEDSGLAHAYLEAFQEAHDAYKILSAELAYSHPEQLEELNRERSLEEMWEEAYRIERELEESQGGEDSH
jgi:hypothetical protein